MKETINMKDVLEMFVLTQGLIGINMNITDNSGVYDKKRHEFVYVTNPDPKQSDLESISCTLVEEKVDMQITFYGVNNKLYQFLKNYNGGRSFLNRNFKNVEQFQRFLQIMQTQSAKSLFYRL